MTEIASPNPMQVSQSLKESLKGSEIEKGNNNKTLHHPVTGSNGGAAPAAVKNSTRGAATPNSAQKKKQGAIALAGLFANGGDKDEVNVEPPALESITEVVTLSSASNSGSFETGESLGKDNNANLAKDMKASKEKRKVEDISQDLGAPVMEYGGTVVGVVVPPPTLPPLEQEHGSDSLPKKKIRQSQEPAAAANNNKAKALPVASKKQQKKGTVVSTPQKVASILASQLPQKSSVPPGVPLPALPPVPPYLPPSSGKTSFEQLMQATTMTSPVPTSNGQPIYRALPTQWSNQRAASMPYLNGQVPQQKTLPAPAPASSGSRKDKSLGVLCQSFMELYKHAPPNRDDNGAVVEIVEVAAHLGVKRRRIYDIINILESIDIVARVRKNTYRWHGTGELPRFFAKLQRDAIDEQTRKANGTWVEDPNKPKVKGMAMTCQKLIQIFLSTGKLDVTLEYAADVIMGPAEKAAKAKAEAEAEERKVAALPELPNPPNPLAPPPIPLDAGAQLPPLGLPVMNPETTKSSSKTPGPKAMKTKVRRMYDIANVLQALGVLTKYNVGSTSQNNKPSLKWTFYLKPNEIAQYASSA